MASCRFPFKGLSDFYGLPSSHLGQSHPNLLPNITTRESQKENKIPCRDPPILRHNIPETNITPILTMSSNPVYPAFRKCRVKSLGIIQNEQISSQVQNNRSRDIVGR